MVPYKFTKIAKIVLHRRSLQTMYFSFIRPVLEYADVVCDNCTDQRSEDLEKKISLRQEELFDNLTSIN